LEDVGNVFNDIIEWQGMITETQIQTPNDAVNSILNGLQGQEWGPPQDIPTSFTPIA
jgi:hypothetical protein